MLLLCSAPGSFVAGVLPSDSAEQLTSASGSHKPRGAEPDLTEEPHCKLLPLLLCSPPGSSVADLLLATGSAGSLPEASLHAAPTAQAPAAVNGLDVQDPTSSCCSRCCAARLAAAWLARSSSSRPSADATSALSDSSSRPSLTCTVAGDCLCTVMFTGAK